MRFLPLFFVLLPVLELLTLIKVGSALGALNTVALVIAGVFLGLAIIRRQGFSTLFTARSTLAQGEWPAQLVSGGLDALAGFLIMLPGFITDFIGLALLVPGCRRLLVRRLLESGRWNVAQAEVYEGEFYRETGVTRVSYRSESRWQDGNDRND